MDDMDGGSAIGRAFWEGIKAQKAAQNETRAQIRREAFVEILRLLHEPAPGWSGQSDDFVRGYDTATEGMIACVEALHSKEA